MKRRRLAFLASVLVLTVLPLAPVSPEGQPSLRVAVAEGPGFAAAGLPPGAAAVAFGAALSREEGIAAIVLVEGSSLATAREAAARALTAGLVLVDLATKEGGEVTLSLELVGAGAEEPVSLSFRAFLPDAMDLYDLFFARAAEAAAARLREGRGPASEASGGELLLVTARPGTRIEGIGKPFVMPAEGRVERALPVPALIAWKASAPGHLPLSGSLAVSSLPAELSIGLPEAPRWALETGAWGLSFPEFGIAWRFADELSARLRLSQFFLGFRFPDHHEGGGSDESFIVSVAAAELSLGLVLGLGSGELSDSSWRVYASLDGGPRFVLPGAFPPLIDPVAPLFATLALGGELGSVRRRVYAELGCGAFPFAESTVLASLLGDQGIRILLASGGILTLSAPVLRAGIRWYL